MTALCLVCGRPDPEPMADVEGRPGYAGVPRRRWGTWLAERHGFAGARRRRWGTWLAERHGFAGARRTRWGTWLAERHGFAGARRTRWGTWLAERHGFAGARSVGGLGGAPSPPSQWTRCRRCGFVEGPASPADTCAAYREHNETGYSGRVEAARHAVYAPLLERVPPWGGRRSLDVGSGAGVFVRLAAGAGWDAVGVDPAGPEVVETGVRLVRAAFPPPPTGPFELVTFIGSLNYMADPVAALAAARSVLVPGGRVLIRVPNASFHLALRRLARTLGPNTGPGGWLRRGTIVHARAFTAGALDAALARAGFRRIVVEASPPSPGDPYGSGARGIAVMKTAVRAGALVAETVLRQPLLLTSSLLATAVAEGMDC